MSERNIIQRTYDAWGRDAGFEKKSGSWYCRGDEVIAVSNLQKSNYSRRYYWNQAFYLPQVGDEKFPKAWNSHVYMRLEGLLPDAETRIHQLLDLEFEMADDQRVCELRELLDRQLLPLLQRASTVAGLRSMHADGMLKHALITGSAQKVLGISPVG